MQHYAVHDPRNPLNKIDGVLLLVNEHESNKPHHRGYVWFDVDTAIEMNLVPYTAKHDLESWLNTHEHWVRNNVIGSKFYLKTKGAVPEDFNIKQKLLKKKIFELFKLLHLLDCALAGQISQIKDFSEKKMQNYLDKQTSKIYKCLVNRDIFVYTCPYTGINFSVDFNKGQIILPEISQTNEAYILLNSDSFKDYKNRNGKYVKKGRRFFKKVKEIKKEFNKNQFKLPEEIMQLFDEISGRSLLSANTKDWQ